MNRDDQRLLGRAVKAHQGIAESINRRPVYLDTDRLPAELPRELAARLDQLAAELRGRAEVIDATVIVTD